LKVLSFSTTSFHFPRSWTKAIQFLIFIWQMSCLMLSSHLCLGLPCDLLLRHYQLNCIVYIYNKLDKLIKHKNIYNHIKAQRLSWSGKKVFL
jgi:hypothetical protein